MIIVIGVLHLRAGLAMMRALPVMFFTGALLASVGTATAQRHREDPDWPCVQRLVPTISAGALWSGPDVRSAGDWRSDPEVAALVRRITPRRVTADKGEEAIAAFAEAAGSGADRDRRLTLVFAGLLEETNRERSTLISRIKDLGRRQKDLAQIASEAREQLRTIPATVTGEAAARRSDLEQRMAFVTRAFEGGARTLTYVCQEPVELEARLGRYARALQEKL